MWLVLVKTNISPHRITFNRHQKHIFRDASASLPALCKESILSIAGTILSVRSPVVRRGIMHAIQAQPNTTHK